MKYNILIAEDDEDIIELLTLYLDSNDFIVFCATNGKKALDIMKKEDIHIVLVDIMMPEMNGYTFIKNTRSFSNIPIIIISAKSMDQDKILGLDIGADVYITKPFNPLEVVAYVKSMIRRYYNFDSVIDNYVDERKILIGELELDLDNFILRKNGRVVILTAAELKIISKLMKEPERIFTKAQLYEAISNEYYMSDDNTMMVHISNIRSKIESDPANPEYIKTIRGIGYKIENKKN